MTVLNLLQSPVDKVSTKIKSGFDLDKALEECGLNWGLREEFIATESGILVPGKKVVIREDNNNVLGVVSNKYASISNKKAFGLFQPLLDSGEATLETGGHIGGGKKTFLQVKIGNGPMVVTGDDVINKYLLLTTGHDGSSSLKVIHTPIRMYCMNQLATVTASGRTAGKLLKFQHTPKIHEQLEVVAAVLGEVNANFEKTLEAYKLIANKEVKSKEELRAYIHRVFDLESQKVERNIKHIESTTEKIVNLFDNGRGTQNTEHTLWRAYNAITEYTSHEVGNNDESRLNSLMFGNGDKINKRALQIAIQLAA